MGDKQFFAAVELALSDCDVAAKLAAVARLGKCRQLNLMDPGTRRSLNGLEIPGRPEKPALVSPRDLPRRALSTSEGRAALVHAVAHIEFNAINLALDAVWRFRGMPADYYQDWLGVAVDEARHFGWLNQRLTELGYSYGAFPAHNGLWEAACKTAADPLLRMALVPRVLEARGLDVTPAMIKRLRGSGDEITAKILVTILDEEVAHVAIGTRWFRFLCAERELEPDSCFARMVEEHMHPLPKGPLNMAARRECGFSETELEFLLLET